MDIERLRVYVEEEEERLSCMREYTLRECEKMTEQAEKLEIFKISHDIPEQSTECVCCKKKFNYYMRGIYWRKCLRCLRTYLCTECRVEEKSCPCVYDFSPESP